MLISVLTVTLQQVPCDPFENGSTPEIADEARANGEKNPNSCLCSSPCNVDKVSELVRLYYIKGYEYHIRNMSLQWIQNCFKPILVHKFRKWNSYRELNAKNPMSSHLFNFKGHLKFLVHGYTEQGTKG